MPRTEKTTKADHTHRDIVRAKLLEFGFEGEAKGYLNPASRLFAAVLALGERVNELERQLDAKARAKAPDLYLQSRTGSEAARRAKAKKAAAKKPVAKKAPKAK